MAPRRRSGFTGPPHGTASLGCSTDWPSRPGRVPAAVTRDADDRPHFSGPPRSGGDTLPPFPSEPSNPRSGRSQSSNFSDRDPTSCWHFARLRSRPRSVSTMCLRRRNSPKPPDDARGVRGRTTRSAPAVEAPSQQAVLVGLQERRDSASGFGVACSAARAARSASRRYVLRYPAAMASRRSNCSDPTVACPFAVQTFAAVSNRATTLPVVGSKSR